ncbi:MAG: redoxin domain-containing protein [Thermomicrobiales bacterium]
MTNPGALTVPVGCTAPDFALAVIHDGQVTVSDVRGRIVVMAFYPGDLIPVRGDQCPVLVSHRADFEALDAFMIGIPVDGIFSHAAIAGARGIGFDLVADLEPKGAVARRYGVYRDDLGFNRRALVVIDTRGIVRWVNVIDRDGEPDRDPGPAEGLSAVLEVAVTDPG